ncbi:hypothetical protein B296_00034021 [Ensete ventricosum]|uniref:Uncharacterized protein n=1 Tax=Ensete ventricosum TaxID=4639 RepID=A0A426ZZP8_ENSVE|nr:hypothetical protein B296_00034021 [Ensete ventricosum]
MATSDSKAEQLWQTHLVIAVPAGEEEDPLLPVLLRIQHIVAGEKEQKYRKDRSSEMTTRTFEQEQALEVHYNSGDDPSEGAPQVHS